MFRTLGQLERFLENYLTENNTSVGGTLADNSKLIDNSINMFRLTKEEETILRKRQNLQERNAITFTL